ncbi:MAG: ATP-binding protein [Phototrophicaceae bacterium]
MRHGRPIKPIISVESVAAALKSLDYSSQSDKLLQPLENLLIVDVQLQQAGRPSAEDVRGWVLRQYLADLITQETNKLRQNFRLTPVTLHNPRDVAAQSLVTSFSTTSDYLKGWHILFLRFVRPELTFAIGELAQMVSTHHRTIQRYQEKATLNLRDLLIQFEWNVRRKHHQIQLHQKIPHPRIDLVGRNAEIDSIMAHLAKKISYPINLLGESGIGKSALVSEIAYRLGDDYKIDQLLWIHQPTSTAYISNKIWDAITPESNEHWRSLIAYTKFLLVIDGVDQIDLASDDFQNLLHDLQQSAVIITQTHHSQSLDRSYTVILEPVSSSQAMNIMLNHHKLSVLPESDIIDELQGNPREIIRYAKVMSQPDASLSNYPQRFSQERVQDMPNDLKMLHLFSHFSNGNVNELTEQGLLLNNNKQHYIPSDTLLSAIKNYYLNSLEFRQDFWQVIDNLLNSTLISSQSIQIMLLNIISTEWLQLDKKIIESVLIHLDIDHPTQGLAQQWEYVYLRYFGLDEWHNQDIRLLCNYATLQRQTYKYESAQKLFDYLVEQTGLIADFSLQRSVMLNLGTLEYMRGNFRDAQSVLNHVLTLSKTQNDLTTKTETLVHLARIAIAQQDGQTAISYLKGLDLADNRVFTMFCEAKLLIQDWEFLHLSIPQALQSAKYPHHIRASLYTIYGRAYLIQEDYNAAIIQLNEALSLTEQHGNQFDIGRARTNLCSAYLMMIESQSGDSLNEIASALETTHDIQRKIQDRVGIEATTRNLRYLNDYRLRNK